MALMLNGTTIDRIGVVDDNQDARETLSDELRFAAFNPQSFSGPFSSIDQLITEVMNGNHAVVCDHHFTRNYAPGSGAQAVAGWYERQFPPVLVTAYNKAEIDKIRRYRRHIPVLLTPV